MDCNGFLSLAGLGGKGEKRKRASVPLLPKAKGEARQKGGKNLLPPYSAHTSID